MVLSAIEVYNKPDFKGREQVFVVLAVAGWEALLKAKILKDNRNRMTAIYVKRNGRYKRTRTGEYMTIGLEEAVRRTGVTRVVEANISQLVRIRDAALHLTADSPSLPYLVFALGAATLRNYSKLAGGWFGLGLSQYDFYILPLGFAYPFKALTLAELQKEPDDIAAVITDVSQAQDEPWATEGEFCLVCELKTTLISAKKMTGESDLVATVQTEGADAAVVRRDVNILDQYPFTYGEVLQRVREAVPGAKQQDFNEFVRRHDIKNRPEFAKYNFRSKTAEKRGPNRTTPVVYNSNLVRFAIEEIGKRLERAQP
jgi:hypothetical protein